jgi:hypothetical protein
VILKSFIHTCAIATLLTCSISVFANNEQIKCPSIEFIKSTYTDSLDIVSRTDHKEFYVQSTRDSPDDNSKYSWELEVHVYTSQEDDFNEAYKSAVYSLDHIAKAENVFADEGYGRLYCAYLDQDNKRALLLSAGKDRKFRK